MPRYSDATVAAAILEQRRRQREREAVEGYCADPLKRLFDPGFTDPTWYYEGSYIGLLPGVLHAKQVEALSNPHKHRWLFWGNQAGKTTVGAVDMVLRALGRHPLQLAGLRQMPPFEGWASALSWKLWQNILLPELLTWIPRDRVLKAPQPRQDSTNRVITLRADNGTISHIEGKSAEQGAKEYQSFRVHEVWLDEEHPESVWEEVQPRLAKHGGDTLTTATPLLGLTYVHAQVYEPVRQGDPDVSDRHWYSHAGMADNPGIPRESIVAMTKQLAHNPSRLASRLHGLFTRPEGVVYQFGLDTHGEDLEGEPLKAFVRESQCYGHVDFGKWRFAFAWGGVNRNGDLVMIDEVFSQNETSDERATRIHKQLTAYGVTSMTIWGDCAAPDDMLALNQAFARIDAPWYILAVEMRNKSRPHGVSRVQDLIARGALRMRRTMGHGATWYVGKRSNSDGHPIHTSRWLWEIQNWAYPIMPDGKAQTDDPDDDTADGADMMDGLRYLAMQWLGPLPEPVAPRLRTMQELMQDDIASLARRPGAEVDPYGTVLRQ